MIYCKQRLLQLKIDPKERKRKLKTIMKMSKIFEKSEKELEKKKESLQKESNKRLSAYKIQRFQDLHKFIITSSMNKGNAKYRK